MVPLYPLRFAPIFKPAIWGGRKLADMFAGAPADGPTGEAWVLSDQGDNVSVVVDGPLRGTTLRQLMLRPIQNREGLRPCAQVQKAQRLFPCVRAADD